MSSIEQAGTSTINYRSALAENNIKVRQDTDASGVVSVKNETQQQETVGISNIEQALDVINNAVSIRSLTFSQDELSGKDIVTVLDSSTKEVIRQIPSEEVVQIARQVKRLQEEMNQAVGVLVDSKV